MNGARYMLTWRPIGVRVMVATVASTLAFVAFNTGFAPLGAACIAVALGCLLPNVRDRTRDGMRAGAPPSLAWWVVAASGILLRGIASELGLIARLGSTLNIMSVMMFATVMLLPVATPHRRRVARRADGVALRCTNCGYDMEGVPGAVCPECGEDCGLGGSESAAA
jgi:hypothetical protein